MIEKLQQLYGEAVMLEKPTTNIHNYDCFETKDGTDIYIAKNAVTEKEKELLALLLTPVHNYKEALSKEEVFWRNVLFNDKVHNESDIQHSQVRFIHFYIPTALYDKDDFLDTMKELFYSKIFILWESNQMGTIIEYYEPKQDRIQFHEFIEIIASDLFINIQLFVGHVHLFSEKIKQYFHEEKVFFQQAKAKLSHKKLYKLEDVFPILFLHEPSKNILPHVAENLFSNIGKDDELLQTIRLFIECNLNISLASKKLFIHRNSLQYRIDRFIEKTGIDIKSFKGAFTTYVAIVYKHVNF
ncbi:PucR family transcriptional regulator [Cytobacillus sp. Hm23]